MIHVDRSTIPPPEVLSTLGRDELARAEAYYGEATKYTRRPFRFEVANHPRVRHALDLLFDGKCAYCEVVFGEDGKGLWEVDHFRPVHRAFNLDGQVEPGYFWLGVAWSNLYPACPICNRNKGDRFPVHGERFGRGEDLERENAVLLDPCRDDPSLYLVFLLDGRVAAASPDSSRIPDDLQKRFEGVDRGQITIDILGLNRAELVESRKRVADELKKHLTKLYWRPEEGYPPLESEIRDLIRDDLAYAGLRRQLVAEWLEEMEREWGIDLFAALATPVAAPPESKTRERVSRGLPPPDEALSIEPPPSGATSDDELFEITDTQRERIFEQARRRFRLGPDDEATDEARDWMQRRFDELGSQWLGNLFQARVSHDVRRSASDRLGNHEMRQAAYAVDAPSPETTTPLLQAAMITAVEIENFRAIDRLSTRIGTGGGDQVGWKVLLGENGVGKSTVLQAVAIALMGQEHFETLVREGHLDPSHLLRRGTDRGRVTLHLSTTTQPIRFDLTPDGVEFANPTAGLRTILLGFGSARWLPRTGSLEPDDGEYFRVRNLFNPFVPLGDALDWLRQLPDERFEQVDGALVRLLGLPDDAHLVRRDEQIRVVHGDQAFEDADSLGHLSDGYQTVLAMACDVMELMGRRWGPYMASAEGVVLVDEIGAHLHPRWKLRVVKSLREAFPRIQFLVTTHEPLCLRGLYDGELLVMRRREGELVVLDDLESPDGLRVDQLLTSPLFGLQTTLDPELEQTFEEYYSLLARKGSLSPEEIERLEDLRQSVGGQGVLGDSPRDQAVYELVDEMLAKSRDAGEPEKKALREDTRRRMAALWDTVEPAAEGELS